MSNPYEIEIKWWLAEFCSENKYNWLITLFPEFNTRLTKFAVGVYVWHMTGAIDLNNCGDVDRIHSILKVIDNSPAFDFFDNVFNEADPETVCGIIGLSPKIVSEEEPFSANYHITEVKNYKDLERFKEAASWCIVLSEEAYHTYCSKGSRFIICENADWWEVPCQAGANHPLDNYGLSLIAVEVSADNCILSITTRWNEAGDILSESYLKELLGDKYNMLYSTN